MCNFFPIGYDGHVESEFTAEFLRATWVRQAEPLAAVLAAAVVEAPAAVVPSTFQRHPFWENTYRRLQMSICDLTIQRNNSS